MSLSSCFLVASLVVLFTPERFAHNLACVIYVTSVIYECASVCCVIDYCDGGFPDYG